MPSGLPRGTPVCLTYAYTESQVLEVLVKAAGRESRVTIARATGLSEQDIAVAAVFLASPAARHITGETLLVDAGSHLNFAPLVAR